MKYFRIIVFSIAIVFIVISVLLAKSSGNIKVIVSGEEILFNSSPIISKGVVFIPVDENSISSLASKLGAVVKWQASDNKFSISKNENKSYMIINNSNALILNIPVGLSHVPFIYEGHPYVPLNYFSSSVKCYYNFDVPSDTVYLMPKVVDVSYVDTEDGAEVIVDATGPIEYTSKLLSDPPRIAIDIPDAVLELNGEIGISNEVVKSIKASQYSTSPNTVRVVVELNIPIAARVASRIRFDQVKLKLNFSNENMAVNSNVSTQTVVEPPVIQSQSQYNPNTQQITGITLEEKDGLRKIYITATGPLTYEWHRLKSPDNRFYIDFTDAVLPEKKLTIPVQDELLSDIRVAQYNKNPNIVRLVFKLGEVVSINLIQSKSIANQLVIDIGSKKINESTMATLGNGSVGYLVNGEGKTVVIDPGHGGGDYGAINPNTGLVEKDVTLDIALRLQDILLKNGWNAILTRSTDRDVSYLGSSDFEELQARVDVANNVNADLFISIHCDASTKSNVRGTTSFYYGDKGKALAMSLQQSIAGRLGTANRGIKSADYFVLKHTTMPATLAEIAFISNIDDAKLLATPSFRQDTAEALYEGICQYVKGSVIVGEK